MLDRIIQPKSPSIPKFDKDLKFVSTKELEEALAKYKEECEEFKAKANEYDKEIRNQFDEFKKFVIRVWGSSSNFYKYVNKQYPPHTYCPSEPYGIVRELERRAKESEKQAQQEKEKQSENERMKLTMEAIEYLKNRGITDIEPVDAIHKADEIAFDEEVKRYKESGEFIPFSGQNCEEPCRGWCPASGYHRCDCGNRRVAFVSWYGHSFKSPSVYAEAY